MDGDSPGWRKAVLWIALLCSFVVGGVWGILTSLFIRGHTILYSHTAWTLVGIVLCLVVVFVVFHYLSYHVTVPAFVPSQESPLVDRLILGNTIVHPHIGATSITILFMAGECPCILHPGARIGLPLSNGHGVVDTVGYVIDRVEYSLNGKACSVLASFS